MPIPTRHILPFLALMTISTLAGRAAAEEPFLPGGASTLREVHGDWSVACAITAQDGGSRVRRCALSQTQLHNQTRQRALAIELHPEGDGVNGSLVLPFGLALGAGVTYQLDEGALGAPQPFRTCLPVGCLIDIAFDATTVASLKTGNAMTVNATADGGDVISFSVSLTGFSSAYDRVVALMEQ